MGDVRLGRALRVWDAKTARAVSRLDLPGPDGFWETVSGDGRTAVSVDLKAKLVRFHDLPTGKITREVPDDFHRPLALSPAGDRLVGLDGVLMTVANRKELVKIDEIHGRNSGVRFSTDGRRVIAATMDRNRSKYLSEPPAREVAVVDAVERKELRRFGNRGEGYYVIEAVALSGNGKTAVTAERSGRKLDEQVITLWETETGRERGSFVGHIGAVTSVAISPDGRLVVTGAADTTALVWDAARPPVRHASGRRGPATTDLAAYVRDLAGDNAEQAYASVWELVGAPKEAVAFLGEQRALFERADGQAIRRWIGDLDSDKYAERERASLELGLILDEAEPQLKKALSGNPSAERAGGSNCCFKPGARASPDGNCSGCGSSKSWSTSPRRRPSPCSGSSPRAPPTAGRRTRRRPPWRGWSGGRPRSRGSAR